MLRTHRIGVLLGIVLAMLACSLLFEGATQEARTQPRGGQNSTLSEGARRTLVPGEIVVKLAGDSSRQDLRELNRQNDARTEEDLPRSAVNLVDLPPDLPVREAIAEYEASPAVEYAEPNFRFEAAKVPSDAYHPATWGLHNTGQTIAGTVGIEDADIDAQEAWDATTGAATPVAVIDTGVDVSHPDLAANAWSNPDEIPGNGEDDDANGYVDDVRGWDFYNDDASVYDPVDGDEHGTHVAGTIAAVGDNGIGVAGTSWRARIVPLKFLGPAGGTALDAVAAIDYAVEEGIAISNNSWGGNEYSQALREAIARADANGHLVVAAAGNGGPDGIGDDNDGAAQYPSNYDLPNVVSVAASDNRDDLSRRSNYGANTVDLAAPGVDIYSTLPGGTYGYHSGTSMATPHVAGVAALVKGEYPSLDDAQIKGRILDGVDEKAALAGKVLSGGRLNAANATAPTTTAEPPPDTTKPTVGPVSPTRTRDRTPLLSAAVRDDQTDLRKGNIRLYVDGRRKGTFSYDAGTDRLKYRSPLLPYGRHTLEISATDAAGNVRMRSGTVQVVRR